jgi:hypothetical protein
MRSIFNGREMQFKSGHANLYPNRLCTLVEATGVVNYAYQEEEVNCISIGDLVVNAGDNVTVLMFPVLDGRSFFVEIADTGSRGDSLYLDVQASQGAATGKAKYTKGTALLPLGVSDVVTAVAGTGVMYQTNKVNNLESVITNSTSIKYKTLAASGDLEASDLNGISVFDVDATAGDVTTILPALADVPGCFCFIHVANTNDLILTPDGTETINGGTAGAAVTLTPGVYSLTKTASDWKLSGQ